MTKERYKKGDYILVPSLVSDKVLQVDTDPKAEYLWASGDDGVEYFLQTSMIKRKISKHEQPIQSS